MGKIDADDVRSAASGRWESILASLSPDLRQALERPGRHVPCPVHGGKDGFRVFKDVDDTGGGVCNTCGKFHDGFSTLMWANGWSFRETLEAVASFLGISEDQATPARAPVRRTNDPPPQKAKADDADLRKKLNAVWGHTVPLDHPSAEPARLYLARRGLSLRVLPDLRFVAQLPYWEEGAKGWSLLGNYPALVGVHRSPGASPVTLRRIYLTPDGRKADVPSPKKAMMYPRDDGREMNGSAIRLSDPVDGVLAVAEGVETGLAVMDGTGLPVWVTGDAGLLEAFTPPDYIRWLIAFADKDRGTLQHPLGHGQDAAKRLVARMWERGIKAMAVVPSDPVPDTAKSVDWLDVLNRRGKAGFPSLDSVMNHLRQRKAA